MHVYGKLINKVINELGLRKTLKPHMLDKEDQMAAHFRRPFITVSRDPGSGGRPIAKLVAKKLGYEFYDKKLLVEIAKSAKMRKELMAEVDEKSRTLMTDFVHSTFNPDYVSDVTYMRHLCKAVLVIAQRGKVVILGRGANFITPAAAGLHVRITAPYRVRMRRAQEYEGYSLEEAREQLKKVEEDRRKFIKQYFDKNISNARYYDLTLNTAFYTLDQAAGVIVRAFKEKFKEGIM